MTHADFFAGVGGVSLGFKKAGIKTVVFVEKDPSCRNVLRKNFPDVNQFFIDISEVTGSEIISKCGSIDIISAGFPCQDISFANTEAEGITGHRSGLWKEVKRLIREIGPGYVLLENVAALLSRGLDVVLADLAEIGFDAEWGCIQASAVGCLHHRDRVWVLAYPRGLGLAPLFHEIEKRIHHQILEPGEAICNPVYLDMDERGTFYYPEHLRVAHEISRELVTQGIKQMGNSVVHTIPQIIGEVITQLDRR